MKEIFNSESMQALVEKGMDLGIEAGKSIIVAVVIYFVGKALITLVNRMLSGVMERRKVDPAIQSFAKSLVNILMMILLIISVVSALGVNTTSFAALLASGGVAVGMALSSKHFGNDYKVYALLGDGEIQEGQVWEAAMFAGHKQLDTLCAIVDNNNLQIDGTLDDVNSPYPIAEKFQAFNWYTIEVDGHDFDQLEAAFKQARENKGKPTAIIMNTVKGKGVSFMEDKASWHGSAPNDEQYEIAMAELKDALAALEA